MQLQFKIPNRHHGKLFRFLNKHAPDWVLTLRPENELYQWLCDRHEWETEREFANLQKILPTYQWKRRDDGWSKDYINAMCNPVAIMTAEQAVLVKMFWEGELQVYGA